jgi:metal-responsive CopG/Arc/MetJ family transcriptional regulator
MKPHAARKSGSERLIFTLPHALVAELEEYAAALRGGNKSGFVADALRAYIDQFRRRQHTQRLRQSYAQAADAARAVQREWEPLDDETWAKLDGLERRPRPHR